MRVNKWTVGLAAAGLVSLPSIVTAEEKAAASPVMTALSSTTISGYVDTSAHWNPGSGNANNPAPYLYNKGKADGFNLDKVKVTLDKPLDEANWAAGYRVDLLFGPDANVFGTQSVNADGSGDLAIQQAYVALNAPVLNNGIDFKLGVFNSIIGYESHDSVNDPNYTRSYAVSLEPHTHTGFLATYQVNKIIGLAAGIANTLTPPINGRSTRAESCKTYMGAVELTAPDEWGFLAGSKLYIGAVDGFGSNEEDQSNLYIGATVATPIKGFKVGGSFDYVEHLAGLLHIKPAHAYNLYASYQMEKWGFHLRGEYADAFRTFESTSFGIAPLGGGQFAITENSTTTGESFNVFALTGTISYDLWKNVLTRLEVRWDHAADGREHFGGEHPGEPGLKNEWLIAANVIYKF